jgi:integrase
MVGVFTAQRVSDYNNIGQENLIWNDDGSLVINLRQKKTGVWVSFPARDELKEILAKYEYKLPHINEKALNSCIKDVAKAAGIDTPVTIETTAGGVSVLETYPKYALIHTHTARRTAATLMYLVGMDVFNICSVTGHSSIAMLKKYIKADEIDRARTIGSDAAFRKW